MMLRSSARPNPSGSPSAAETRRRPFARIPIEPLPACMTVYTMNQASSTMAHDRAADEEHGDRGLESTREHRGEQQATAENDAGPPAIRASMT